MVTTALSGGDVVIASPGLLIAAADDDAVTVGNNYTANCMFHRSAVELAIRAPAQPAGGDAAVDRMIVQDARSGISFEISFYKGFQKAMIMVAAVWGYKVWKPEGVAIIMG